MPESQSIRALFTAGMTREEFLDKFAQMQAQKSNGDEMSIFDDNIKAETIGALFDEVDKNKDRKLDNGEIYGENGLQNYSKKDGENKFTDDDIKSLYDKTVKNISGRYGTTDPQQLYEKAVQSGDYTQGFYNKALSIQIDMLQDLITERQNDADVKIKSIEQKMNDLIESSAKVSAETKEEERKTYKKLKENEQKMKSATIRKADVENRQNQAQLSMNYLAKRKEQGQEINEDEYNDYSDTYSSLSNEFNVLSAEITESQQNVTALNKKMNDIRAKAVSEDRSLNRAMKSLNRELDSERLSLTSDLALYNSQIGVLSSAKEYADTMMPVDNDYTEAYDEDASKYCKGAEELKDMWMKKWTKALGGEAKAKAKIDKLGGQAFFNKVFEVSQRLHCDANALMGVMNSESGVDPSVGNAAGGAAVGLVQFMPRTAQALGTTSSALKNMSAIKQLDYVEKMINYSKKVGGISSDQNIDSATLYTLVFLPAYAKRDVLTARGHKFYEHNRGLDLNNDGVISKADMAARVRKFMA